jgi:hypothetical protein
MGCPIAYCFAAISRKHHDDRCKSTTKQTPNCDVPLTSLTCVLELIRMDIGFRSLFIQEYRISQLSLSSEAKDGRL